MYGALNVGNGLISSGEELGGGEGGTGQLGGVNTVLEIVPFKVETYCCVQSAECR